MPLEDAIVARIEQLITQAQTLTVGNLEYGNVDERQRRQCAAWLVAAVNVVHRLCETPNDVYRKHADSIMAAEHGYIVNNAVGEMAAVLQNLLGDAKAGLISSVADHARAEIFDDFLDHAAAYVAESRKNEAGVIAGVVFEDAVRRLCKKRSIVEKDVKLDQLISVLNKSGDLTDVKAKRARVAAHVRTKASHAQWDEFDMSDVNETIEITRELVSSKLDA